MNTPQPKLIIFSRYSISQAATRVRALQYIPALTEAGFNVEIFPILDDKAIAGRSSLIEILFLRVKSFGRVLLKLFQEKPPTSFLHIHIELFPWIPFFVERSILCLFNKRKYSIELDDAWFHRYENHQSSLIRFLLGTKIDRIMQSSSLVVAGNQYIADRAIAAGAKRVEIIPTVVDMQRYQLESCHSQPEKHTSGKSIELSNKEQKENSPLPKIGWIGTPATTKHLNAIESVIRRICDEGVAQFVAIGADALQLKGLPITVIPWEEKTEVESLHKFAIGIMPLTDTLFERGKCGYKLIQYMACGLPVVASPVGVNSTIVMNGKTGYLAKTEEDWFNYLSELCINTTLRQEFGQAGLARAEGHYSLQVTAPKFVSILHETFIRS